MNTLLPLQYRWLRANGIKQFVPWYFINEKEGEFASRQFSIECPQPRMVLTFARRQDRDDFAGFEIINNVVNDRVINFHPAFSKKKELGLISGEYPDILAFLTHVVLPDTAEWASEEDLIDILNDQN
jgi:hypothetical protein